jgi:hypothetical protein
VFIWLPHLLDRRNLAYQNPQYHFYKDPKHPLTIKGWNHDPIARRVIDLKDSYYILTQQFCCRKVDTVGPTGCGSFMNLYDPSILHQLDPTLVDEFPAFLTHRSRIDKTLIALI